MSMAPPAARRKSDAAAERRRQLEEWKKKKEAQRKRQSIGGRTSLGGGAASSRPSISGVSDYSRRGSSGTVGSVAQGTPTSRLHAAREQKIDAGAHVCQQVGARAHGALAPADAAEVETEEADAGVVRVHVKVPEPILVLLEVAADE